MATRAALTRRRLQAGLLAAGFALLSVTAAQATGSGVPARSGEVKRAGTLTTKSESAAFNDG
jgi:hypothetical protein